MSHARADSIRARLLNRAKARGEDYNLLLTRYALERWLYRLSISTDRSRFVLKGALLFAIWNDHPHRPTRDVDLLGIGDPDVDSLRARIRNICRTPCDDGIQFDAEAVDVAAIREGARYDGLRAEFAGLLGVARIHVQVDVGFGDVMTPEPQELDYPTLLDDVPAPRLAAYSPETVVAEKVESIVVLGMRNSRMKDYFDLWILLRDGDLKSTMLARAIRATADRRGTALPESWPMGLDDEFAMDAQKRTQWQAFINRNRLDAPALVDVVAALRDQLAEPLRLARTLGDVPGSAPQS